MRAARYSVHWSDSSNTEQTVDTSDRELESSTARSRLGLPLHFSTFTTSGHVDVVVVFCVSILTPRSLSP